MRALRLCCAGLLLASALPAAAQTGSGREPPASLSRAPGGAGLESGLAADLDFMLDPIVVTAPRQQIQQDKIDPRINAVLLRLLRQRSEVRPSDIGVPDTALGTLSKLTTLKGHKLRTRYTELGFLLTEGLAGVTDYQLQLELERTARAGKNPQIRAASMVALAYTKDQRFLTLFQEGLRDADITVRLGALESLILLGGSAASFSIENAARADESPTVRILAAAEYWRQGNLSGREILLRLAEDPNWYVRASAIQHIGHLGRGDEYRKLLDLLDREQNKIVRTELVRALMHLEKYK